MKSSSIRFAALALLAAASFCLNSCSSSSPNVVTVAISPSSAIVLAGQVATFTATVSGATTTTSTFSCQYTVPVTNSNGTVTTSSLKDCPTDGSYGTWTQTETQSPNVLTYTAPALSKFPNPIPTLTFTAKATTNTSKTATTVITLDSGIRVSVTPAAATVPVGFTPAQFALFTASFLNTPALQQTWILVQPNTSSSITDNQTANPLAATCSPTCGSIDSNGKYTAPSTLPTDTVPAGSKSTAATTVYAVVSSAQDPSHYAIATITLTSASTNPSTFQSIYPTSVPAGSAVADIYLNAKNLLNSTQIFYTAPGQSAALPIATTNIYEIPISSQYCTPVTASGSTAAVTCDGSLMTRIQLTADQLALPGTAQIQIASIPGALTPTPPCTGTQAGSGSSITTTVTCPLQLTYASPALVSSLPDSLPQPTSSLASQTFAVDGGYFGGVNSPLVKLYFDGQATILQQPSARQLTAQRDGDSLQVPGLYEVSVQSNAPQGSTPPFPTVTANVAVQPNFANVGGFQTAVPLPTTAASGTNLAPSAMAVESPHGYAVMTEQAGNSLQLIDLTGALPAMNVPPIPAGNQPTSISIDDQISIPGYTGQDLAVVVSSGDNKLYEFAMTRTSATPIGNPIPVDLATLISEPGQTGLSTPFSIGVDPTTHLGVVTYQNTNIAFIVDVNPNLDGKDTHTCFITTQTPPCVIAPVSVNTGTTPQVIVQPQVPLAYVTPGGTGTTSVVDLLLEGTKATIAPVGTNGGTSGAVRTAGITKIICNQNTPHGINPATGGTVIISGLMPADLNGTYQVIPASVTDAWTFSYSQPNLPDETETNTSANEGSVQYGSPYYSFSTTSTVSGGAINPVTRKFGYADYNASVAQIGFIGTLDQSLSSLTLTVGSCYSCTPTPAGAPERGWRSVAFDPFVNAFLAYNPSENLGPNYPDNALSIINPGGVAPNAAGGSVNQAPYRIVAAIPTNQAGMGTYTPSGATAPITVYGPMGYDPKTKWVLIGNAGSNTLSYMNLQSGNAFKQVQIQSIQVASGGVPNKQPILGAPPVTSCSPLDPNNPCMPSAVQIGQAAVVKIFGEGFLANGSPVVHLDGNSTGITILSAVDNEVDIALAPNTFTVAHDYALDVTSGTEVSNAVDLHAVGILNLSSICTPTSASPAGPEGVAIDESRGVAIITNYSSACNSVSVIAIRPSGVIKSDGTTAPFGTVLTTVGVGTNPIGIDVLPRLGYVVVANNYNNPNGTATILQFGSTPDILNVVTWNVTSGSTTTVTNAVTVGLSPLGVAIDQDRALALVANNGSNTLSDIDLTVLQPGAVTTTIPTPITIALTGPPTAVAVDNNDSYAVVSNLQYSGTVSASAGLDVIDLATSPPTRSATASINSLTAAITGLAYDPITGQTVYAVSTQGNSIYDFNPTTGTTPENIQVGINPYSIAYNPQTATMLSINSTSNTSSVIDTISFKTRQTLGISSQSQFAAKIDSTTNIAVIVDQNNNRVVFLGLPK